METDELCRTCLGSENVMVPLFKRGNPCFMPSGNVTLVGLIKSLSEIEISHNDGLPLQICKPCMNELQQTHSFKLKCRKSENTLLKLKEAKLLYKGLTMKTANTENSLISSSSAINKGCFFEGEIIAIDDDDDDDDDEGQIKTENPEDDFSLDETHEAGFDMTEEMIAKLTTNECTVLDDDELAEITNFTFHKPNQVKRKVNANIKKKLSKPRAIIYDMKTLRGCQIKELDMKCPACSEVSEDLDSLRKHIIENHTKEDFCYLCDEVSGIQTADIWRHCIEHLPKKYVCPVCGKCFIKRTYLRAHFKLTHGGSRKETFPCKLCTKSFKTRSGISYHRQVAHAIEKPYCCEICNARFAHIKLLRLHMLNFHTDGPPKCRFCGQMFNAYSTMMKHVRRFHKGLNKMKVMDPHHNNFQCVICAKPFSEKYLLEAHVIGTHTNFRQFKCTHCPFTFKYKSVMAMHINTQHPNVALDEVIDKCEICFKLVPSLDNLLTHMEAVHTSIRPYLCVFCSYSFKIESNLENHLTTIHANKADEIEYKCDECNTIFNSRDNLLQHRTLSHNSVVQPASTSEESYDATNFIFRTMFQ